MTYDKLTALPWHGLQQASRSLDDGIAYSGCTAHGAWAWLCLSHKPLPMYALFPLFRDHPASQHAGQNQWAQVMVSQKTGLYSDEDGILLVCMFARKHMEPQGSQKNARNMS